MTLVVEDGTGLTDAESYIEVADIRAYLEARGLTDFSDLDEDVQEQHARKATDYIEQVYGSRYRGSKLTAEQALLWPRSGVVQHGFEVGEDEIPVRLMNAVAEAAERSRTGTLLPDIATDSGQVVETTSKVGPIEESIRYAEGSTVRHPVYPAITHILSPLLIPSGRAVR